MDEEDNLNEDNEPRDYSTDDQEDEDAVLLTEKVEATIFTTLLKIKNKSPEIYDSNLTFFDDSDFDHSDKNNTNSKSRPYLYNDMVRESLLTEGPEAFENGDTNPSTALSYVDEQEMLKKDFIDATKNIDFDDDFIKKSDAVDSVPDKIPDLHSHQQRLIRQNELISRYWSSVDKLDENEEFLKDYILNQRWREDRTSNFGYGRQTDESIDEEDEEHIEKADEFEYKYNYRFEEADGCKLVGYPRTIDDSVRNVDDKRRKRRLERKKRLLEEKVKRDEEIKRLKNIKKNEMKSQMSYKSSGNDINPDTLDQDQGNDVGNNHEDPEVWWKCDHCNTGISAGKLHHDCKICDNFTLCDKCLPISNHEHNDYESMTVPLLCAPPDHLEMDYYNLDYEDVIGDTPVRFKYRNVEPMPCDVKMILEKTDKELNSILPLHRLIAYDSNTSSLKRAIKANKRSKYSKSNVKPNVHQKVDGNRIEAFGLGDRQKQKRKLKENGSQ